MRSRAIRVSPGSGYSRSPHTALIAAVAGTVMMVLFSSWLLPGGDVKGQFDSSDESDFLTELTVRRKAVGQSTRNSPPSRNCGGQAWTVTAVKRLSSYIRHDLDSHELRAGDRIVAQLDLAELISLRQSEDFQGRHCPPGRCRPAWARNWSRPRVAPSHPSIGNRLFDIPFLSQLDVRILGMTRYRNLPRSDLTNARIHAADRLLVTGSSEDIRRMYQNPNLFGVGQTKIRAFRRDRAPIAIGALVAVVVLAALNIIPLAVAAILAVGAILLARCIDAEEAWGSIDGNVLVLIFGMLAVGLGLQQAGSVDLIVTELTPFLKEVPPWGWCLRSMSCR